MASIEEMGSESECQGVLSSAAVFECVVWFFLCWRCSLKKGSGRVVFGGVCGVVFGME